MSDFKTFQFFLKKSFAKIKTDPCALFGCNNDYLFPKKYTVKDHISSAKLEKGDHYYIQTGHKDLFSHYNLILRKLCEKIS